ncbi:MAG: hypothetical protein QOD05_333, partial [Microbacteriaceae bacterium]|nr:hypothetical protein [Microbacteriaceae bacterium]
MTAKPADSKSVTVPWYFSADV